MPNAKLFVQTAAVAALGWMLVTASHDVPTTGSNIALMEAIFGYALFGLIGLVWDRVAQLIAWFRRSEPKAVRIEPHFGPALPEATEDSITYLRGFGIRQRGTDFF